MPDDPARPVMITDIRRGVGDHRVRGGEHGLCLD
jgi:hypothetical protein